MVKKGRVTREDTRNRDTVISVGIIGTGFGLMHLLGFRKCENVRVVAVCQRTPEKAEAFAQQHSVPYAFTDYRQVIDHPEV